MINNSDLSTPTNNVASITTKIKPPSALVGSKPPLLLSGEYKAIYLNHDFKIMFGGRPKLFMAFIIEQENQRPVVLTKFYNVGKIIDRDIKAFQIGWKSNLLRDYVRLFGWSGNVDELTSEKIMGAFNGKTILCRIDTVKIDSNKDFLPKELWYSAIGRLIEVTNA